MWSPDQQRQHHQGACCKCRTLGSIPDFLKQKYIRTRCPSDLYALAYNTTQHHPCFHGVYWLGKEIKYSHNCNSRPHTEWTMWQWEFRQRSTLVLTGFPLAQDKMPGPLKGSVCHVHPSPCSPGQSHPLLLPTADSPSSSLWLRFLQLASRPFFAHATPTACHPLLTPLWPPSGRVETLPFLPGHSPAG